MTIQYVKHHEIDAEKWNNCIKKSNTIATSAYYWYLNIVCDHWDALIADDYKAVMPLPYRKKIGIKYIYQPSFIQLGIFSDQELTPKAVNAFLNKIPIKFLFVHFNLAAHPAHLFDKKKVIKTNHHQRLNLNDTYENIYKHYRKDTKKNIKRGQQHNLQIEVNTAIESAIKLIINNLKSKNKNFTSTDFQNLRQLITESIKRQIGYIYNVFKENDELIFSAFFLKSNLSYTLIASGGSSESKQLYAQAVLKNFFIQQHAEQQFILDFAGSNIKGVADFNKGFGATDETYPTIKFYPFFNYYFF